MSVKHETYGARDLEFSRASLGQRGRHSGKHHAYLFDARDDEFPASSVPLSLFQDSLF